MRSKNKLSLLLAIMALSTSAVAADGYREMKFGSPTATVLAQANCTMEEPEEAPVGIMYSCEDFVFSGKKTEATLFFVNEKFTRITIALPDDEVAKTIDALKKQYAIAAQSTPKEMQDVEHTPNKSAFIHFDNNHISLLKTSDEEVQVSTTLTYAADNIVDEEK